MLARSQIEILGDTEKMLAERIVEGARTVHPYEPRASRGGAKAIGGGAKSPNNCVQVASRVNPAGRPYGGASDHAHSPTIDL